MNPSGAAFRAEPALTLALAGTPNAGKTTIFNALTGERRHVGNYPGVTVERIEGETSHAGQRIRIVDLPGTYSLTAYSIEEVVARTFILEEQPDAVVSIVDASNPERNLYLTVQLMELGVPLVVALNMSDVAARRGLRIDTATLERLLGVPVIATVGVTGEGIPALLAAAAATARQARQGRPAAPRPVEYGHELEPHVTALAAAIARQEACADRPRWYAVKLLEADEITLRRLRALCPAACEEAFREAARLRSHIERISGESIATVLADARYGFIAGACSEAVARAEPDRLSRSEGLDRLVLSRWFGLPLFAGLMYLLFQATFALGEPLVQAIEWLFAWLARAVGALWPDGSDSLVRSLVTDGLIGGVGGVVAFLPNILLLFLAIALLEDTGYMARAAYLMDSLMHRIGLHGKSFIPMLIGFGCTVPAILATRTLESRRDRLTTILVLPLMSCGARLTIYTLFIPAFFPAAWRAPMLWLLYIIGIALAAGLAKWLRVSLLKGEEAAFVMELPPYRAPTLKGALIHTWERGWLFVRKAGTIILGLSAILWAFSTFPRPDAPSQARLDRQRRAIADRADLDEAARHARLARLNREAAELALEQSALGRIGHALEPLFRPLGFDWRVSSALVGAVAAKELFVAQLAIANAVGDPEQDAETLRQTLRERYTPLQGFSIMLFCLISMPCIATLAVTRQETGSWTWAFLQLTGLTALAWILSAAVFQVGRLLA